MQYPGPSRSTTGIPSQGTKRSRTDETTQVSNKAARLGSATNKNITQSSHGANGSSQPAKNRHGRRLSPSQNMQSGIPAIQQINSRPHGLVPGPDYGRAQTNRNLSVPPPLDHRTGQTPTLNNDPGPAPKYPSLQAPSEVQDVQHGLTSDVRQSGLPHSGHRRFGAFQSGPPQSNPHQSGPQQSVPQQFDPHAQNGLHPNMPRGDAIPTLPHVNTTNLSDSIRQSNSNYQSSIRMAPLPPQLVSQHVWQGDGGPPTHISRSIARLSSTKVLEVLATATMYHSDVFAAIGDAVSHQEDMELQKGSVLFEHLLAVSKLNEMKMAPPAQGSQYSQPQYFQAQCPPQHSQARYSPPQHISAQAPQPVSGRDIYERNDEDRSEESSEDDESEESDEDEFDTEPLSFEARTRRVHYILHAKYAHLRDSQQVHITYDAAHGIMQQVQKIADAVQPYSLYITKHRAIGALYNIGMIVIEADGYMGNRVKNHLAYDPIFIEAFQSLYDCMTEAEREDISHHYLDDLEHLDKKRDFCFEGFDDIVKQFREVRPQAQGEEGKKKTKTASIDLTA